MPYVEAVERLLSTLISTKLHFPCILPGQFIQNRAQGAAVASPRSMEVYEHRGGEVKHFSAKRVVGDASNGSVRKHMRQIYGALHFPQTAAPPTGSSDTILRPAPGTPDDDTAFARSLHLPRMTPYETNYVTYNIGSLLLSVNGWSGRGAGAASGVERRGHKMQAVLSRHQQPSDERYQPFSGPKSAHSTRDNVSVRYRSFFCFLVLDFWHGHGVSVTESARSIRNLLDRAFHEAAMEVYRMHVQERGRRNRQPVLFIDVKDWPYVIILALVAAAVRGGSAVRSPGLT